jgi:hypothetical protein
MGSMMQQKMQGPGGPGGGGGAQPQGALMAQSEAVKKVIDQMSKMEPSFGPFADRIKSLLDAGLGAVMSAGGPGAGQPPAIQGPNSMKPEPPGSGFPG